MGLRVLALIVLLASPAWAQAPLVQAGDVTYLGSFSVPNIQGTQWTTPESFTYGGYALGMGADGQSLYIGGHAWHNRLARISIPPIGGTAKVLTPLTDIPNLAEATMCAPGSYTTGGTLAYGGRLISSVYVYYDGAGQACASHWASSLDLTNWQGPVRVGPLNPGFVAGYMGTIPAEWRAALGGPAFTGQGGIAIISRSSYGPSLSVFDPDQIGKVSPVPATMLVGYPADHPLGQWNGTNPLFNGATGIGGVAFVPGTRSVLFIGRHGDAFCYGTGTECGDPTDNSKGTHAYPYRHQVWAYDANDLAAVKRGEKQPWDVKPHAVWPLVGASSNGDASIRSVTFDPATRRIYLTTYYGESPRVHVWQVGVGSVVPPPPPPPEDCKGTWSGYQPTSEWTACANGAQSRTEANVFAITTPASNGGLACPVSPVTRTEIRACVVPTVDVECSVVSVGAYADKDAKLTARCNTNGLTPIRKGETFTLTVPKP